MNKNMFRMKPKASGVSSPGKGSTAGGISAAKAAGWEVRPGGMLVQQRNSDSNQSTNPVPTIKVRVKYGSSYHEVNISSQASFGDLKKMLAGSTGLHHQDQKLIYKDRERDSKVFLDVAGVKDGSKLVLIEDEISRERRSLESRKNGKMEKASKDIAAIRVEVDKLAKQVASIEMDIYGGKKVTEKTIFNLTELLMAQLIKLDGIDADGDVKLQRRMQVTRVQKYIETLDMLKMRNSSLGSHGAKVPYSSLGSHGAKVPLQQHRTIFTGQMPIPSEDKPDQRKQGNCNQSGIPGKVMVTTKWETF